MMTDSIYFFGISCLDLIGKITETESVRRYTAGFHLKKWGTKLDSDARMSDELKKIICEINEEYELTKYMDKWSRLYFILTMSAIQSAECKPVNEKKIQII